MIEELDLLGNRPGRDNRKHVSDKQKLDLVFLGLTLRETNSLSKVGVGNPSVDQRRMESMHIEVDFSQRETLGDRFVPVVECLQEPAS